MTDTLNVPAPVDEVDAALAKARVQARRARADAIGRLLDKATDVLSDVLDDPQASSKTRLDAASLAVSLYVQQENAERQDKSLEIQQKRLEIEEQKLRMPGGALFQQNNLYLSGAAPVTNDPQLAEIERQALLERKKAQDAILRSYLPDKGDKDT